VHHQLLVFGGSNGAATLDELWSFNVDSLVWRRPSVIGTGPPAREGHTGVIDLENQMVIFGGAPSPWLPPFNDTWAYDPAGHAWHQPMLTTDLPPARWRHSATFSPANRRMRVFGGLAFSGPLNDNWILELLAGAVDAPVAAARSPWLRGPTPNPCPGAARVEFAPPAGTGLAELSVYDVAGRRIATLWSGQGDGATRSATWDGRGPAGSRCAAGVYFVQLRARGGAAMPARKLVLM
jgi:hypothetical protein